MWDRNKEVASGGADGEMIKRNMEAWYDEHDWTTCLSSKKKIGSHLHPFIAHALHSLVDEKVLLLLEFFIQSPP